MEMTDTEMTRFLAEKVTGPRDYFRIEHCKREDGKSYYSVFLVVFASEAWRKELGEGKTFEEAALAAIAALEGK